MEYQVLLKRTRNVVFKQMFVKRENIIPAKDSGLFSISLGKSAAALNERIAQEIVKFIWRQFGNSATPSVHLEGTNMGTAMAKQDDATSSFSWKP